MHHHTIRNTLLIATLMLGFGSMAGTDLWAQGYPCTDGFDAQHVDPQGNHPLCSQRPYTVGYNYERGILGFQQNYEEAMQWYQKAAAQRNDVAVFRIGYISEQTKDYGQAMLWYQKAAAQGNSQAVFRIGYLYEHGWGVTKDTSQALQWYQKAASLGNDVAKNRMVSLQK
jgi:TPR repeat protein